MPLACFAVSTGAAAGTSDGFEFVLRGGTVIDGTEIEVDGALRL